MRRRDPRAAVMALALLVSAMGLAQQRANADVPANDGMPSQAFQDGSSSDLGHEQSAGWGDLTGGVAARPYVTALSVTNGAETTPVVVAGTPTSAAPAIGDLTTVISPVNLCRAGQAPAQGQCYSSPNRVAVTVGYRAGDTVGYDLGSPSVALNQTVGTDTVIDLKLALNSLGRSLRWTYANGDVVFWRTTNLGQADATLHVRLRPTPAPYVASFPDGNGCTATPLRDCSILRADGEVLTASMVLSLDDTLDPALTGAVFSARNALSGYLSPGRDPRAPTLDVQVASTHLQSDDSPQIGTLKAFLPTAALVNLYGLLPADAVATMRTTRTGDVGTNGVPSYTAGTEDTGGDGLWVTVPGITFSVPTYKVTRRFTPVATKAVAARTATTVSSTVVACATPRPCRVDVYRLSTSGSARYAVAAVPLVKDRLVRTPAVRVVVTPQQLKLGQRYLMVVRSVRTKAVLTSSVGVVRSR